MSLILKNLLLQKVNDTCHHLSCKSLADRGCRRLMFRKSFEGQAFQRHVFKEIYLTMGIEPYSDCKNRCLMENSCVSVNIGPPDKNGLRVCQLSDSDHTQHPDDLKPQEGYLYWASKVRKKWILPGDVYLFIFLDKNVTKNKSVHVEYVLQQALSSKYDLRQWVYQQEILCLMCKVGFMGERCEQGKKRTLCFGILVYSEFFWSSLLVYVQGKKSINSHNQFY